MDLTMGIASLSVGLTEAKTQQGLQLSMKAMDMAGEGVEELLAATGPASLDPNLGTTVDVQA